MNEREWQKRKEKKKEGEEKQEAREKEKFKTDIVQNQFHVMLDITSRRNFTKIALQSSSVETRLYTVSRKAKYIQGHNASI